MTDTKELIERLKKAEGPDADLDAAIAVAVFETVKTDDDLIYAKIPHEEDKCAPGTYWRKSRSGYSLHTAPRYTESVDAARTLVPEGLIIEIKTGDLGGGYSSASVLKWGPFGKDKLLGFAELPTAENAALVLCIAALEARAA